MQTPLWSLSMLPPIARAAASATPGLGPTARACGMRSRIPSAAPQWASSRTVPWVAVQPQRTTPEEGKSLAEMARILATVQGSVITSPSDTHSKVAV